MKKIIPFILILIVLIGLFSPKAELHAQAAPYIPGSPIAPIAPPVVDTPANSPKAPDGFECGFTNIKGCIASISYDIWTVSSKIAQFGGYVLDFFVYYSTNSTSYDNPFISKGWGAVRDVANIFFIITLLYIAIKTVLSLDSHGSKKMIGYVIIIALIINFSLFTTKVVIDSSNILAKIFYNNITSVGPDGNELKPEDGGEKSISLGLIKKFDPQQILNPDSPNYDAWTFIFIALFLVGITLYTAYVFFAIAVLFVARVVSLWLAMIFSPLAFISYAVPFDVPFGHKEWWDDLLKNAFLAPIFIFFLYVIVLFTDFLKTLAVYPEGTDIFQKLMSVAIPFAILMMLLMKAKGLAVKYSGKIGEAVVSGAKMIGGLALGSVALGGALAGRSTVGAFMKGSSTGDSANQRFARGEVMRGRWDTLKGAVTHYGTIGGLTKAQQFVGTKLNDDQHEIEHATHARHTLDNAAGTVASGKKWNDLNGEQRNMVRTNLARAEAMREAGLGNKTWAQLTDIERAGITTTVNPLLASRTSIADTLITSAQRKQGFISNTVQSSVTGTYDIRNLANVIAKEQSTGFAKITSGITGALAKGIRGSFGKMGINTGKAEGKFLKDLGSTISESLKSVKINVDLSHVSDVKKENDKGGGGHH